jgi:hypothetical protein
MNKWMWILGLGGVGAFLYWRRNETVDGTTSREDWIANSKARLLAEAAELSAATQNLRMVFRAWMHQKTLIDGWVSRGVNVPPAAYTDLDKLYINLENGRLRYIAARGTNVRLVEQQ